MILQLSPAIPLVTPKGKALAHFLIDMGLEHDLQWVCFNDKDGECWTWKNPQVRAQKNITQGREHISPFYKPEDVALKQPVSNPFWLDEDICPVCSALGHNSNCPEIPDSSSCPEFPEM